MATAKAYVAYAQAHPGMYSLMFRNERIDMTRPSLHEAASARSRAWRTRPAPAGRATLEALSLDQAAVIARAWSLVHGFTMLLLDGRLKDILHRSARRHHARQLLDAMMRAAVGRPPGDLSYQRFASSTARPVSPITFTSSLPHVKLRANSSAALRASSLGLGLAWAST